MQFPLKEIKDQIPFARRAWESGYIEYDGEFIYFYEGDTKCVWTIKQDSLFADDWSAILGVQRKKKT